MLMGGCRLFVYLVAASAAANRVGGQAIWGGLALASYIMGLSYLARKESSRSGPRLQYWPCIFLAAPVVLAGLEDDGLHRQAGVILSVVLVIWILWALRQTFWQANRNIGFTVSRLLAGIALVDLLATGISPGPGSGFLRSGSP